MHKYIFNSYCYFRQYILLQKEWFLEEIANFMTTFSNPLNQLNLVTEVSSYSVMISSKALWVLVVCTEQVMKLGGSLQFMMEEIQDSHWKIYVAIEKEILTEEKNEAKKHWMNGKNPASHHLHDNRQNCRYSTKRTLGHSILVGMVIGTIAPITLSPFRKPISLNVISDHKLAWIKLKFMWINLKRTMKVDRRDNWNNAVVTVSILILMLFLKKSSQSLHCFSLFSFQFVFLLIKVMEFNVNSWVTQLVNGVELQ